MTTLQESDVAGNITCHNIPEEAGVYLASFVVLALVIALSVGTANSDVTKD